MKKLINMLLLLTLFISVGCERENIAPPAPEPEPIVDPYLEPIVEFGIKMETLRAKETRTFISNQSLNFNYNDLVMTIDAAIYAGENANVLTVVYAFPSLNVALPLGLQASVIVLNSMRVKKDDVVTFLDSKYSKADDVFLNGLYAKQWGSKDGKMTVLCFDGSLGEDGSVELGGAITVVYVSSFLYNIVIGQLGGAV